MTISARTVTRWRSLLISQSVEERRMERLSRLRKRNYQRFVEICRHLAADTAPEVRLAALRMLGYHGERHDLLAERAALAALDDLAARDAALLALGRAEGLADLRWLRQRPRCRVLRRHGHSPFILASPSPPAA
jgi:hypothetical protein